MARSVNQATLMKTIAILTYIIVSCIVVRLMAAHISEFVQMHRHIVLFLISFQVLANTFGLPISFAIDPLVLAAKPIWAVLYLSLGNSVAAFAQYRLIGAGYGGYADKSASYSLIERLPVGRPLRRYLASGGSFRLMLFLRIIPLIPFAAVTLGAYVLSVPVRILLIATFLGCIVYYSAFSLILSVVIS
jgi:uncharacterized membrane protein YdjX (TVP38/TMEM64 family)